MASLWERKLTIIREPSTGSLRFDEKDLIEKLRFEIHPFEAASVDKITGKSPLHMPFLTSQNP